MPVWKCEIENELVLEVSKKMTAQYNVLCKLHLFKKKKKRDFPGGPVVNNLPSNAEDAGWSLVRGHMAAIYSESHNFWRQPQN